MVDRASRGHGPLPFPKLWALAGVAALAAGLAAGCRPAPVEPTFQIPTRPALVSAATCAWEETQVTRSLRPDALSRKKLSRFRPASYAIR